MKKLKHILIEAETKCPAATQDVDLNTKNRNSTRKKHAYGPMNPSAESDGYWEKMSEEWKGATPEEARGMRCGNCVAFDVSNKMQKCLPAVEIPKDLEDADPMDVADSMMADLPESDFPGLPEDSYLGFGYCWMHHFKCHSARTCDTWAKGGPIKSDKVSKEWSDKAGI